MQVHDILIVYLVISGILAHSVFLGMLLTDCSLVFYNALAYGSSYCTLSDILHMDTRVVTVDGYQNLLLD